MDRAKRGDPMPVINEEDFKPKKNVEQSIAVMDPEQQQALEFKNEEQKKQLFFKEYEIYKENKSKFSRFTQRYNRGAIGKEPALLHSGAVLRQGQKQPRSHE